MNSGKGSPNANESIITAFDPTSPTDYATSSTAIELDFIVEISFEKQTFQIEHGENVVYRSFDAAVAANIR